MKRPFALLLCLCALLCALTLSVFAHPGGTDSSGGHTDQSTGEYHYHHGYPAHYHTGGRCPYDFDDKTGQNSGTPSTGSNGSSASLPNASSSSSGEIDPGEIIAYIGVGLIALFLIYVFIGVIIDKLPNRRIQEEKTQSAQPNPPPPPANPPKGASPPISRNLPPLKLHPPTSALHATPPRPPMPRLTTTTLAPLTATSPSPTFASGIIAEHPVILDADPDYLTEAQVLAYALSIETPRGKKAVTEQFVIKGDLTTNETTKPFQASANVMSLGSAQQYQTTLVRCSCPDHRARHLPCKHMIALAIHVNAITVDIETVKGKK